MSADKKATTASGTQAWVSYRPEITVLDCTIRDGGLMNNSHFTDDCVRAVYAANVAAGVDYMEIGYKNSAELFSPDEYGCWRHSDEDDMRRIVGDNPDRAEALRHGGRGEVRTTRRISCPSRTACSI